MESSKNRLQYDQIKVKPKYCTFSTVFGNCKSIVVFHIKTFCIIENRFCMDVASLFFLPIYYIFQAYCHFCVYGKL